MTATMSQLNHLWIEEWIYHASAVGSGISVVYVTTSAIGLSAAQQGPFVMVFAELHNG